MWGGEKRRAELLAHIQITNSQYTLPAFGKKIPYKANPQGIADTISEESVPPKFMTSAVFPRVQDVLSCCRLVKCAKQSTGGNPPALQAGKSGNV